MKKLLLPLFFFNCILFAVAEKFPEKSIRLETITINDGLSQGMVTGILQDRYGFIWFATKDGLNRYDGYKFTVFKHDPSQQKSIADNFIQDIYEDKKGRLWIGTSSKGLDLFDRESETFIHFQHDENDKSSITKNEILRITETSSGQLVLALNGDVNIVTIAEQQGKLKCSFSRVGKKYTFPSLMLATIGNYRYKVTGQFLIETEIKKGQSKNLITDDILTNKLLNNINCIYADAGGVLWIGTKGYGILKYNPYNERFHHTDNRTEYFISPAGNNQVVVYSGGESYLKIFDAAKGEFFPFTSANDQYLSELLNSNKNGIIDVVCRDNKGIFWIGKNKLISFNPASGKADIFIEKKEFVFPIYVSDNDEVWCSTEDGFCLLNTSEKKLITYPYPFKVSHTPYKFIEVIYRDASGIFWLGTTAGLFRFDAKSATWTQYKNNPADSASISFDVIFTICPDPLQPERYLWIGTNGGLNRFDKTTGKCVRYSEKNGLPNSVIYGILSDNNNNLWMSTNNGIARFNIRNGTFKNYKLKDGLQSNEFNRNAFCKVPEDGTLYFGGVNGFNYFNPNDIQNSSYHPRILITDFKLNSQPVVAYNDNSCLQKPAYLSSEIKLPYNNNVFSFDFSSIDYSSPKNNIFQYRLEGFNDKWVQSNNNNSATYTNLNPGTYTFRVQGSNRDGVWSNQEASIRIIILPPWYLTWWFRIGLIVLVSIIIYGIYKYRLNQTLQLQAIRNRIAGDLHDEIGSTLSSISLFSEVVKKKSKDKLPEVQPMLTRITDNIDQMMEALSDIVWTINADNDSFEQIVNRMRATAAELFEAKGYELHIEIDEKLNSISLGMQERKNVFLLFKEAINNISKYADGKNVWIQIHIKANQIILTIKDDGKGFNIAEAIHGNGMTTMKKRAAELGGKLEINSIPQNGTSVMLLFPFT